MNLTLTEIHFDHLSHILSFLNPNNLLELATTCSTMKSLVYQYCSIKSNHDLPMIKAFFENEKYLTPNDSQLKEVLEKYQSPLTVLKLGQYYGMRVRVSCTDVDFFPHSTDANFFNISEDEYLQHNVVTLKSVCWLEIKHSFKSVKPGKYKAAMRIKFCDDDFEWPSYGDFDVLLGVWWKDSGDIEHSHKGVFKSADWYNIKVMVEEGKSFNGFPSNCALNNHDKSEGWFNFELSDEIIIDQETQVKFSFQDVRNSGWKSGLCFDFIELIPFI